MRDYPLQKNDTTAQNARLAKALGNTGFLLVKAGYGLLRRPKTAVASLRKLSALSQAARREPGALPFDARDWKRRFTRMLLTTGGARAMELAEGFYGGALRFFRREGGPALPVPPEDPHAPIVLLAAKNERLRMEALFAHYRALGVQRFAVVDNGSTDGTREFLLAQPDADVFETRMPYRSAPRMGWLNRVAACYGTDRWFLWADADELLAYPRMEERPLPALTRALEARGEWKLRTFLLEMYPDGPLLDPARRDEDFLRDSAFFDPDSDDYALAAGIMWLSGGMRRRVFGLETVTLTKVTLLHFGGTRMLTGAHTVFPQLEDCTGEISGALLHYKFLPRDLKKYESIAAGGAYANGSAEYKRYLAVFSENPRLSAMRPESARYTGSASLCGFSFLRDPFAGRGGA